MELDQTCWLGLCLEPSLELIIGVLGILKAGGAYVPFDPAYPQERLSFMLADSQAPVIVTQERYTDLTDETRIVCLDRDWSLIAREAEDNFDNGVSPDNLAYVMYTSGSTGIPKGVSVNHRAVVRLVQEPNYAELNDSHTFLQLAPVSFDASTLEIWGSLLNGARLALMQGGTPSLQELGSCTAPLSRHHTVADRGLVPLDGGPAAGRLAAGQTTAGGRRRTLGRTRAEISPERTRLHADQWLWTNREHHLYLLAIR